MEPTTAAAAADVDAALVAELDIPIDNEIGGVKQLSPIRPSAQPTSGCNDWPYALVFLAMVGLMVGVAVHWGLDAIRIDHSTVSSSDPFSTAHETRVLVYIALAVAALSLVLSLLATVLVTFFTRPIVPILQWSACAIALATGIVMVILKAYGFCLVGFNTIILALLFGSVASRFDSPVATTVRIASAAVTKHWSTYAMAMVVPVVQTAWLILCLLAILGIATTTTPTHSNRKANGEQCLLRSECASGSCRHSYCAASFSGLQHATTGQYFAYVAVLVGTYWGLQVLRHIASTTVAGTVAAFWFGAESSCTTGTAFSRSLTTSFGTICYNALVDLALHWSHVYITMYGFKRTHAERAVLDLFQQRQFHELVEKGAVGTILTMPAISISLICANVCVVGAKYTDVGALNLNPEFLALVGFVVGLGVASTPFLILNNSVSTVIVCFAGDPTAFADTHPDMYAMLLDDWSTHYPAIMLEEGYTTTEMPYFAVAESDFNSGDLPQ